MEGFGVPSVNNGLTKSVIGHIDNMRMIKSVLVIL